MRLTRTAETLPAHGPHREALLRRASGVAGVHWFMTWSEALRFADRMRRNGYKAFAGELGQVVAHGEAGGLMKSRSKEGRA